MTDFDDFGDFDDIELSSNPDPRCPVVLVLDCSDSMTQQMPGENETAMEALNGGLDVLVSELNRDPLAKRRVELSVVTFGTHVNPATPFATVKNLVLPELDKIGITSMGGAVNEALDAIEERKQKYKDSGISYFKPWVLLITDGLPTDSIDEAANRVREAESRGSLSFFGVGVEGADMDTLNRFSEKGGLKLSGLKFDELFEWLSASQSAVSASTPGDRVPLPAPSGWMEV